MTTPSEARDPIFSRRRLINFAIGIAAVALTELGRSFYRPYIRAEGINDFHVADTLGNSFGTIAAIFVFIAFLSREPKDDLRFVVIGAIGTFVFELAQPLLGKSIDPWDLLATVLAGLASAAVLPVLHRRSFSFAAARA